MKKNIFLNNILFFAKNSSLCNCADDYTHFYIERKFDQVMSNLQNGFYKPKVWFYHYVLVITYHYVLDVVAVSQV